jgi:hypothetical protein
VFEVNKSIGGPKALLDLLTSDQFAGLVQKHFEDLNGLALQLQKDPTPAQFTELYIQFEGAEANRLFSSYSHTRHQVRKYSRECKGLSHSGEGALFVD